VGQFQQFQQLMKSALLCGAIAGFLLFVYQEFFVVPRIIAAEVYEAKAEVSGEHSDHHEHSEWKPGEGFERTLFTAAGTILTGISFAAILFSVVALRGATLNVRSGLLWGLAGFACFVAAPSLGLPPEPPAVPVADLGARQLWWAGTAAATAIGLFLIFASRGGWMFRIIGVIFLVLPHWIGAPQAVGKEVVPAQLVRAFAISSIVGNGIFWLTLGIAGGVLFKFDRAPEPLIKN
jgi:cobalt transporter subunit CbtA